MSPPLSRALNVPELDLNLVSLYRVQGKSAAGMPGLAGMIPPRRAAHGRDRDRLIVYLALAGNVPFTVPDDARFSVPELRRAANGSWA